MPRYNGQLMGEDGRPNDPPIHLFDYSSNDDDQSPRRSSYRKQLLAVDSCIYVGRRNLTQIREGRRRRRSVRGRAASGGGVDGGGDEARKSEGDPHAASGGGAEDERAKEGAGGGGGERRWASESEDDLKAGGAGGFALEPGHEFEGYVLKCPNGPYDYALKLWDKGKAAPQEDKYPKVGEEVPALIVDRKGDYLTVACGANIAYATRKSFLMAGVDPDDLSLPFGRLWVSLSRAESRPEEVPAAAWVARPTQVSLPPYDIY